MIIKQRPCVLCISGIDPQGLSGYQADLRALESMGVQGMVAVTALTAQGQCGVTSTNATSDAIFKAQLDSIAADHVIDVVKVGLLATESQADILLQHEIIQRAKFVFDPVLQASSGVFNTRSQQLNIIKKLISHADVITPNWDEAIALLDCEPDVDSESLANELLALGCKSVYLKGGHTQQKSRDFFAQDQAELKDIAESFYLQGKATYDYSARGTGCFFASSLAAALALGHRLEDAVVIAKMQMSRAWQHAFSLSSKQVALQAQSFNEDEESDDYIEDALPLVYSKAPIAQTQFLPCDETLGLYPVVDRAQWLKRLLPLGIKIIQLRIKDLQGEALATEIKHAIELSQAYGVPLFINDHWQLAIELGAYGVHLGQEDLLRADLAAIEQAGLRLGISSHCYFEVARALTIKPSYLAYGPIYHTDSKQMPWQPQGLQQLRFWRNALSDIPMVAIGGINQERIASVAQTGVESIAMISAITHASDPEAQTQKLMSAMACV